MKAKSWLKNIIAGIAIGISSAIPGVSGGTIAIIFKVYEKIIWAISNILKEFKKAIIILLPILLGLVIGLVPTIILMDKALQYFLFGTICIFAGFIIGSLPEITGELKGKKPTKVQLIIAIVACLLAIGLGVLSIVAKADMSQYFVTPPWWLYLLLIPVGFLGSVALAVPGISGGMILIILGFYTPLINSTVDTFKACFENHDFSRLGIQFGILGCFAIGVIIGFYFVSKLMNYLLSKHHTATFFGILGFVVGSLVALFFNFEVHSYYSYWMSGKQGYLPMQLEIPLGIVLLIVAAILAYLLVRYGRKQKQTN